MYACVYVYILVLDECKLHVCMYSSTVCMNEYVAVLNVSRNVGVVPWHMQTSWVFMPWYSTVKRGV